MFAPHHLNNIYAKEAALAEISCQGCGRVFYVALTGAFAAQGRSLGDEIRLGRVHYGDPPNVDCCAAGPCMNSEMLRIVEYWSRLQRLSLGWLRDNSYEIAVPAVPLDPPDTYSAIKMALKADTKRVLVMCTSPPNQYDLAGPIATELAKDGRLLVLCDNGCSLVAGKMVMALNPESAVGHSKSDLPIIVAEFSRIEDISAAPARIVVLSGRIGPSAFDRISRDKATDWLNSLHEAQVVEFALNKPEVLVKDPTVVINASVNPSDGAR